MLMSLLQIVLYILFCVFYFGETLDRVELSGQSILLFLSSLFHFLSISAHRILCNYSGELTFKQFALEFYEVVHSDSPELPSVVDHLYCDSSLSYSSLGILFPLRCAFKRS